MNVNVVVDILGYTEKKGLRYEIVCLINMVNVSPPFISLITI